MVLGDRADPLRLLIGRTRTYLQGWGYLTKMGITVLALIVIVGITGAVISIQMTAIVEAETEDELDRLTMLQVAQMETWLESMDRQAALLAQSEQISAGNASEVQAHLDEHIGTLPQSVRAIHYVETTDNETVTVEASTYERRTGEQLTAPEVPWANHRKTGSYVSALYESPATTNKAIAFSHSIEDDPDRHIVLVADTGTASLNFQAPRGGQTLFVDPEGTILVSTNPPEIGEDAIAKGYLTREILEEGRAGGSAMYVVTQFYDDVEFEDERHLTVTAQLGSQDWIVMSQTPAPIAFEVRDRVQSLLLMLVGSVLLVGTVLLGLLGYTTVRDLRTLSEKTREVEQGNYDISLATDRGDEIGDAYRSVESMRDTLAEHIEQVTLVENALDLITVLDPDMEVSYQSPSAQSILGVDPETLEGKRFVDLAHPEDRENLQSTLDLVLVDSDEVCRVEFRLKTGDGSWSYFEGVAENLIDTPFVGGLVISSRDISERKRYELELERQNEQLERVASVISHDLRNPLNVAKGHVQMAQERDDVDQLGKVWDSIERMETIIQDVLTLAREGGQLRETQPVGLSERAKSAWEHVDTEEATLVIEDDCTFEADPNRLLQLLENLFRNAREHGGSAVTVTVGSEDSMFYIEDDGPGIPPDRQEKVLQEGYTTGADGTGLGLSIVTQIAESHGWHVAVAEGSTGGARFEFHSIGDAPVLAHHEEQ